MESTGINVNEQGMKTFLKAGEFSKDGYFCLNA